MAYETYKKSNIPWIGDIPAHWHSQRIKDCLSFKIGGTPPTKINEYFEGDNIWVSISDISKNNEEYLCDSSIKITDEAIRSSNVKLIKKGSLLFSFKLSVGLTAFAGCDLYTNEAIASFEPNDVVDLKYLKYVFKTGFENNASENIYGAKLFNSDLINFARFVMPPSLEEQQQIANYLDKQTAKIDATIAKNEELIQLLDEKRVALINQVVTKGLNPNVPMKDSGVEWIGEIPEHWEIMKLKHHGFVLGGYAFKSGDFTDFGVKAVKITNVQSLKFDWSECFYLPQSYLHEHSEFKINKGDIVFALTRPIISTGIKAAIFDENEPALANQRTGIFKKYNNNLIPTFLYYVIYSDYFKEDFKSKITATNQPNISPLDIGEIKIIMPSVDEQKQIVSKLDEETKKISEAILKIKENIHLLSEYKTSLIHHVVTGKIDVRGEEI